MNTAIRNDTPESAMAKHEAESDSASGKWSHTESLLAGLIDEVRMGNWAFVQVHSEQRVTRPTPIPRPGLPSRSGRVMSLADAQRIDPRLHGLSAEEAQEVLDRIQGRGR